LIEKETATTIHHEEHILKYAKLKAERKGNSENLFYHEEHEGLEGLKEQTNRFLPLKTYITKRQAQSLKER
jgi:hypothetical protein